MEQVPSVTPAYRGGGGGHGVGGYETGQKKDEVLGRDEHDDKRDGVAVIASSSLPHAGHVGEEWRRRRHSIDSYSDDDDNPAAKQLSRKIENDLISSSKLENGYARPF